MANGFPPLQGLLFMHIFVKWILEWLKYIYISNSVKNNFTSVALPVLRVSSCNYLLHGEPRSLHGEPQRD